MVSRRVVCLLFVCSLSAASSEAFVRGDANQDGFVGIPDLVLLAAAVENGGQSELPFPDAADLDDSGRVDEKDVKAFVDRFFAPPQPLVPAPFPVLGYDPTPDELPPPLAAWRNGVNGSPGGAGHAPGRIDPGGGSDLQYIHFLRTNVLLEPGSSLRVPILLRTKRPIGGVSFALKYVPGLFTRVALDFENSAPALSGGQVWQQLSLADTGRIGAASYFRHEPARQGWSVLTLAYLDLEVAGGVEPGSGTEIYFEELPLPGRASAVWIYNEVSDDRGYAYDLRERSRSLHITFSRDPAFVRGEIDRSGAIDVGDALYVLRYLFLGGPPPRCPDAADVNDDGAVALSDAVALLAYVWAGQSLPRAPFPHAGEDPTADALDHCEAQPLGLGAH